MNQNLLEQFINKLKKICTILNLNVDEVQESLLISLFTDFRNNFLADNLDSNILNELGSLDDHEFMKKLDDLGLNSEPKFNESSATVLNLFIGEVQSKLSPEKVQELRKIVEE